MEKRSVFFCVKFIFLLDGTALNRVFLCHLSKHKVSMIMYFWNKEENNCFCLCIFIDIGRPEKWNSAKVYAELITASFLKKKFLY